MYRFAVESAKPGRLKAFAVLAFWAEITALCARTLEFFVHQPVLAALAGRLLTAPTGPLAAAVNAFTTRSAPSLLPRLYELLGALKPRTRTDDVPAQDGQSPQIGAGAFCTGQGDQQCLAPAYVRDDPMHPDITAYAQRGVMPTGTICPSIQACSALRSSSVRLPG